MTAIVSDLFSLADEAYKRFQSRLIPTVDPHKVIGVRLPALRAYAKQMDEETAALFMSTLPHTYYEENHLHAFLIERITDVEECIAAVERFLPYVDNWATCDSMRPKVFAKHKKRILSKAGEWMTSSHPYTIRYGLEMRMLHGLDDAFDPAFLNEAAAVRHEDYYVRMMVAWYFATALSKQYEQTLPYLQTRLPDVWTHNKAIQKACESRVISPAVKTYLKTLRG